MRFGKLFLEIRRELALTQADMAGKLGISQGCVSKYERDITDWSELNAFCRLWRLALKNDPDTLARIVNILNG